MTRLERLCGKSPAWHRKRRKSIGSSDAKTIMAGDAPALLRLWQEKRGEVEPDDMLGIIPVNIGTVTEPLNLALFEHETGKVITRDGEQVSHPDIPFMGATLDGWIDAERAIIECKHVGGFEAWETVVARYMPQIHHQCACTGAGKAYLSVLIGNAKLQWQEIEPDPFYLAEMIEREHAFWRCVTTGEQPATLPAVAAPVPIEKMRTVDMSASNSWASHAAQWLENRAAAKQFEASAKEIKLLVESDVRLAFGHGIQAKRDKRGVTIQEHAQ